VASNSILANGTGILVSGSGTNPLILSNVFAGNTFAIHTLNQASPAMHGNAIAGNGFGVQNDSSVVVDATGNFWGASNGPSQAGPGSGDKVSTNVNFTPFATVANGSTNSQFQILAITPSHGGNAGAATIQVYGTGFQNGASVKLAGAGKPDLIGSNTQISNLGFTLTSTVNLAGAVPGLRDVVVTNPSGGSTALSGAFTVDQGGTSNIAVSLVGRNVMRGGQQQTYYVSISNLGNIDSDSGLIWVSMPSFMILAFSDPTAKSQAASFVSGNTLYAVFGTGSISAGGSLLVPFTMIVPDAPQYAHVSFQLKTWFLQ
jgi:hypothetical protein